MAEHFVCYDLAKRGIRANISPFENAPYDVIAEYGGVILRIQVKGTAKREQASKNSFYYRFVFSAKTVAADLVAFVALDTENVMYIDPSDIEFGENYRIKPDVLNTSDNKILSEKFAGKLASQIQVHQDFTKEKRATSL